jgi:hypothetical protein
MYYAYARHALVAALRMARVQPGDAVLLPHFICRDVLASLKAVQAVPVFYHVDENLQVPPSIKLPPARAVLAVNYFGFPADLEQLQRQLTDQNSVIIEDNAHGWLSADEYGVALGTRTSLGITSFRKTIRSYDGAFLHWRTGKDVDIHALHQPLPERTDSLPLSYRARRVVASVDRHTSLPLMSIARNALRTLRTLVGKPPINLHHLDETELPYNRAIHLSSLTMMSQFDTLNERQRRREAFQHCRELATVFGLRTPRLHFISGISPQGFPFFVDTGDIRQFQHMVNKRKLGEVVTWPSLPSSSAIPKASPLRQLHLVNFL